MKEHLKWIIPFLIIAFLIASIRPLSYDNFNNPIKDYSDTSITALHQLKINDPSIYPNDKIVDAHIKNYVPLSGIIGAFLIGIFGSIKIGYLVGTIILFVIFEIGIYCLVFYLFKKKSIAVIAMLLAAPLRMGFGIEWGIEFGVFMTRAIMYALTPWLFLFFIKNKDKTKKLIILFLMLGLLANIHPIVSGQIAMVILLTLLFTKRFRLRYIFLFVLGAIPFIIQFFGGTGNSVIISELIKYRFGIIMITTYPLIEILYVCTFLVPILIIGIYGSKKAKDEDKDNKEFKLAFLLTGLLFFICILAEWVPVIRLLRFNRFSALIYLFLVVYSAYAIHYIFTKKLRVLAIALLIILLLPVGVIGKQIEPQINSMFSKPITEESKIAIDTSEDWESFYDIANWARDNTPKNALFLVPPIGFSHFRVYSERSTTPTKKDIGICIHDPELGEKWYELYNNILQAYSTNSFNITSDYIVVDKEKNNLSLPIAYENRRYIVYG